MKLSKYIKKLEKILKDNGDMECCYSIDDEGNQYNLVVYEPSILYINKDNEDNRDIEIFSKEEIEDEEVEKIVCVN